MLPKLLLLLLQKVEIKSKRNADDNKAQKVENKSYLTNVQVDITVISMRHVTALRHDVMLV